MPIRLKDNPPMPSTVSGKIGRGVRQVNELQLAGNLRKMAKMANDARMKEESEKAEEESKKLNELYHRHDVLKWG
jgi:hypothetical protein